MRSDDELRKAIPPVRQDGVSVTSGCFGVRKIEYTIAGVKHSATMDEVADALSQSGDQLSFFHPSVRFHRRRGTIALYVTEEKPKIVSVKWRMRKQDREYNATLKRPYKISSAGWAVVPLAIPYFIRVYTFQHFGHAISHYAHGYFRNEPLESIDDPLYRAPLLNINAANTICFGNNGMAMFRNEEEDTYTNAIGVLQSTFWTMSFNYEMGKPELPEELSPILKWVGVSQKNPKAILSANWKRAGTVRQVLDGLENLESVPSFDLARTVHQIAQDST